MAKFLDILIKIGKSIGIIFNDTTIKAYITIWNLLKDDLTKLWKG